MLVEQLTSMVNAKIALTITIIFRFMFQNLTLKISPTMVYLNYNIFRIKGQFSYILKFIHKSKSPSILFTVEVFLWDLQIHLLVKI